MASKYDAFAAHLRGQGKSPYLMRFEEIDPLVKGGLPITARTNPSWWDNDYSPKSRHSQSKHGWLAAGWEVVRSDLDLSKETVTFRKMNHERPTS